MRAMRAIDQINGKLHRGSRLSRPPLYPNTQTARPWSTSTKFHTRAHLSPTSDSGRGVREPSQLRESETSADSMTGARVASFATSDPRTEGGSLHVYPGITTTNSHFLPFFTPATPRRSRPTGLDQHHHRALSTVSCIAAVD